MDLQGRHEPAARHDARPGRKRRPWALALPAAMAAAFAHAQTTPLTTGTPQLNAFGGLDGYVVRGGTVNLTWVLQVQPQHSQCRLR